MDGTDHLMPYPAYSRWWRLATRTGLAVAWLGLVVAGMGTVLQKPHPIIAATIGEGWADAMGIVLAITSAAAVIGVVTGHAALEGIVAWFAGASAFPYVLTTWATAMDEGGSIVQVGLSLSLFAFICHRALQFMAAEDAARRLRALHQAAR